MPTTRPVASLLRALCLALALSVSLLATVITPPPPNFVLDGDVREWNGRHPDAQSGEPQRPGFTIWLARGANGLLVAGQIRDQRDDFAKTTAELAIKGNIEVWLSVAEPFELPKLSYSEKDCKTAERASDPEITACLEWRKQQIAFRERLKMQFTRKWQIAPAAAQEAYALPAYDELTEAQHTSLKFPRPSALPERRFQTGSDGSLNFEILVSWELFPPANRLTLETLRFRVDLQRLTASGTTAQTFYPGQRPSEDEPLPSVGAFAPVATRITPCGQPLVARDIYGLDQPGFYFLNHSLQVNETFFFDNYTERWRAPFPSKNETSPATFTYPFFAQELDKGEYLCGPVMSYRKGAIERQFPIRLEPPREQVSFTPQRQFPIKRLPNGTRLIRYGPEQTSSPLWGHAWSVFRMKIFALTPALDVQEVLELGAWFDDPHEYQIEISDDWQVVKEYFETNGRWKMDTYCLEGHTYKKCGTSPDARPPRNGLVKHQY